MGLEEFEELFRPQVETSGTRAELKDGLEDFKLVIDLNNDVISEPDEPMLTPFILG